MKNLISFITLTLCIMVSAVNAQNTTTAANTSKSVSQSFHKVVASVVEDVNTEDEAVRNMAMSLEEVNPEAAPVMSVALNKGFSKVVAAVIEDVDSEDEKVRNVAMLLEEVSPEAGVETNVAGNYIAGEKGTDKY